MTIREALEDLTAEIQGRLTEDREGYRLEAVLAERKAFLSKKKLVYQARIRIDEARREVIFSERLKETGLGLASGGDLESLPGIGFKKETYGFGLNGVRSGTITEQSRLFGKQYVFRFDWEPWREKIKHAVEAAGFEVRYRVW